jgi:molybdate transport system substrate-binding protein
VRALLAAVLVALTPALARAEPAVTLHAAGSLTGALTEAAKAYAAATGAEVAARFGPSGQMRERIEAGEPATVFASADYGHPKRLHEAGRAGPVVVFARNRLCAMARPGLAAGQEGVPDAMLDPGVKLGTSTPGSDPSGDYAWALFAKAEALRPGAKAALEGKALKLAGGGAGRPAVDPRARSRLRVRRRAGAAAARRPAGRERTAGGGDHGGPARAGLRRGGRGRVGPGTGPADLRAAPWLRPIGQQQSRVLP